MARPITTRRKNGDATIFAAGEAGYSISAVKTHAETIKQASKIPSYTYSRQFLRRVVHVLIEGSVAGAQGRAAAAVVIVLCCVPSMNSLVSWELYIKRPFRQRNYSINCARLQNGNFPVPNPAFGCPGNILLPRGYDIFMAAF